MKRIMNKDNTIKKRRKGDKESFEGRLDITTSFGKKNMNYKCCPDKLSITTLHESS
jgi:hypothetical protein